jgi:hypothetical protein
MLTIRRTRIVRGPNIWAPVPVIVLNVAIGELDARLSQETAIFFERDCRPRKSHAGEVWP